MRWLNKPGDAYHGTNCGEGALRAVPDNKLELVVEVDANRANASLKGVNANLSSMEAAAVKSARGASQGIDGMTASMTKAGDDGLAIYGALMSAARAIQSLTIGALEQQDAMGKAAQKVGLSVAAYSELKQVAELSGISAEQLATSVGSLSRNMMEAAKGAGEQRRAFEALGVSFRDQRGQLRNAGDVLEDLADRFRQMPEDATQVALSMTLLGRSGREMIPFLNQGGSEIRRLRQEAHDFGLVVGEDALRAAGQFTDNLRRLQSAIQGLKFALANELTPRLVELTDKMVRWVRGGGLRQAITYVKDLANALAEIGIAIGLYSLVTAIPKVAAAIKGLAAAMGLLSPWALAGAGLAAFGGVLWRERKRADEFRESLERLHRQAEVFSGLKSGKTLEQMTAAGLGEAEIRQAIGGRSMEPLDLEVETGFKVRGPGINFEELEELEKEREKQREAEKQAREYLLSAQTAELGNMGRIYAERQKLLNVYGLTAAAIWDINRATVTLVSNELQRIKLESGKPLAEVERDAEGAKEKFLNWRQQQVAEERQFETETLEIQRQALEARLTYEEQAAEHVRDYELRHLDRMETATVQQQLDGVAQKLAIEERYLMTRFRLLADQLKRESEIELDTTETIARARGMAEEQIAARRDAILQQYAERGQRLDADTQAALDAARQSAAIRQTQIIRDENQRIFDSFRRQAEGVFDALLTKGRSIWSALADSLKTALLTAIKEVVTSRIAAMLTYLFTGQRVSLAGAAGGILGAGAAPVFGAIGGGTGSAASTPAGGLGGLTGLGAGLGVTRAGLAAMAPQLGLLGAGLGLMGAFRLGQGGGVGRGLAPALGAISGLAGFGALASFFPALVAAGPVGWIAAAGIGAFAGILGMFRKSAEQKVREKIKATYGLEIREKNILRQIVEIAKQGFGGNLDMAIRSQPVRELVELYAMSTGQSTAGLPATMRPVSMVQYGGALFSQGSDGLSIDRIGAGTPSGGTTVINITVPGAKEFFEQETVRVVVSNPRAVQSAAMNAMKQNAGRRQSAALQMSPGLVVG